MEHILKPDREFFAVSVDTVAGMTYVSGSGLGRQFLLEKLCQIAGTNVFAAFLKFCREKHKVISSKPNTEATIGLNPNPQIKPITPRMTLRPCKPPRLDSPRTYFESLPNSKDAAKSRFQKNSKFQQPKKSETRKESVGNFSRGGQEKEIVTFLHAETKKEISLESPDVEFNESSHQDTNIQSEGNSNVETTEENLDVNNSLVNTFSLQNELPSCINSVLPCNENSQATEETFQVKQEPDWDLENSGGNSLCQETQSQASNGENEHQLETEDYTEECALQGQGIGEASLNTEESLHSTEYNDNLVIKQEPDWDEPEEENTTMDPKNAEVGTNTIEENDDETPDDSEEDSAEEENSDKEDMGLNDTDKEDMGLHNTDKEETGLHNTNKEEETGLYTCNVGDHMYCVPLPYNKVPEHSKESRRVSNALTKLQQAREEEESRREEEESRQEEERAEEIETENKPVPEKKQQVILYRCVIRNPKTGKFCSLGKLKRYEALQLNAQKAKEKRILETKIKQDSTDEYTGRFVFEDPQSQTGYIVRKMEWKCHCGQKFKSQHEFAEHDKEFHNTRLRLCAYCGEFLERRKYKYHVRKHEPNTKKYQCSLCGNNYSTSVSLKRHMEYLHGGKRVPCNECGKNFKSTSAYRRHLLTHKNILNHLCNYCGKKFISKYAMETHARVHTGERPFACEYCGLRFNHNVSRKTHIKKAHSESVLKDDVNDS
ncbi:zinc finger protein 652-B-like isoform X2 [Saccostrea echinata]|uniref:zinc finger protein 652-B-like isoform X2 n=1 Tax=Saccostrea echinata TaxID=191078 RepID=UPI002A82C543|nr:zinc finger protein 652-B-like isoform X2 [Saccostrea echinata]